MASSILYLASGIWQSIWHLASGISHTNLQYHELIPIFVKTHLLHFSPFHLLHYLFPPVAFFSFPLVALPFSTCCSPNPLVDLFQFHLLLLLGPIYPFTYHPLLKSFHYSITFLIFVYLITYL